MSTVSALDSTDIGKIGIGVIIALVVIGFLLSLIITAIVGRIIIAVIVIGLAIFVWQQRTSIENHVKNCDKNVGTFVGVHVSVPQSAVDACKKA
jgi:hypothetical protein